MSEEAGKGPSKNELKKLAKKAEKAAKKQQLKQQQQGGGGGAPAPTIAATTTTTTTTAAAPPPKDPSPFALAHAAVDDPATLKVVWASRTFDVPLVAATATQAKKAPTKSAHACLIAGNVVLSGGGNAMAAAVAGVSKTAPALSFAQQQLVDEWCEWERTVLRPAVATAGKPLAAALEHLDHALATTGLHVASTSDTVADICLVSTLQQVAAQVQNNWAAVTRYLAAHQTAHQAAQQAVAELVQASASAGSLVDIGTARNEPCLTKTVHSVFVSAIADVYGQDILSKLKTKGLVQPTKDVKHGDFQCNAAMALFGLLKSTGQGVKSPQAVAQAIVERLQADEQGAMAVVGELQVNGPGFITCRLQASFLQHQVNAWLFAATPKDASAPRLPFPAVTPQTCVVDFSSPNIAKEMHVGHLRSTIIGEAVCRILESVGHDVHRVNHVGDWGTQFGMLIQYLREEFPETASHAADAQHELPNISDLTEFYKHAKQRFDESAEFKKQSQQNVVQLQSGDEQCKAIWNMLCDVSRREFSKVYNRLDVTTEECGESFYNPLIPAVIDEFQAAGKIQIEEGGAKCVFLKPQFKIPLMLQKSDGGFGYDSTDMAALQYRLQKLQAQRIIVITDFSQSDHFKMVYAAGRDIGWLDNDQQLEHIGFGTVMGEDGKRFKTRSGETVRLVDLLDEAVRRMEASLQERIKTGKANITADEVHAVAEAIGYGAVKYYDLRRNPTSNYKFSYDQMLSTAGDTAVYLLYARVRLESIMDKAAAEHGVKVDELLQQQDQQQIVLGHASERNLALALQKFADTMEQTLEDLYPCKICEYVYKLSIASSDFVTQCKVLGSPEMASRLLLCKATTIAMKQCFDLLGIRHVKRI